MIVTWLDKYKLPLWAILVLAYFYIKVPVVLVAGWSHDDLMNCYRAMTTSWGDLISQVAAFWKPSPVYRPLGEIFYKAMWEMFGFSPLPWRVACAGLLVANAFLLGHLAMRLSNSVAVGLAATALGSYHPLWSHLYLNTGTIFELLAFTFVYLGLVWQVEFGDPWGTTVLLILGLNAKESAIVLGPLVVLYSWIWHRRTPWLFCGLAGVVSLAFIFGRVYGPGGLSSVGGYVPNYSVEQYVKSFGGFLRPLVLWKAAPLLVWLAPLAFRNRLAGFAVALFPIAVLPLAFVPDRGLEGVYIACAALPLALASCLLLFREEQQRLIAATVLFAGLAWLMPKHYSMEGWDKEFIEIRQFRESLQANLPAVPGRVQIRYRSEPFTEEYPWASTFITRLVYKNPDIAVATPRQPASEPQDYAVFEWGAGRLQRIK